MPKKSGSGLNPGQKKAVKHGGGALLVVAGAGTGKTRVITERIRHLVQDSGVKPKEILALTFTEKAANEMLERVDDIMPLGYEEPWIYTFHSFADRILKTEGIEMGLDPGYKVLSGPEQWVLLRQNIFKVNIDYYRPLGNPTKFVSAVLKFISRLQDENITPEDLEKFCKSGSDSRDEIESQRWEELALLYKTYQKLKTENSKMDFGDLITWVIRLFSSRPNVLKKYRKQFKHILVDEFQDTNYAQYEMIKMLFPQNEHERSLVAVGDDSQSIYKFRGAAVSNIMEFMKDYPKSDMVTLIQNYRSSQKILDPAYELIQNNNPDTLESKLGISKKLVSEVADKGSNTEVFCAETLEDEVGAVVEKIYEILGSEPLYTYKDFAILARANSHLEPFVIALRQRGIPYQLVGNRGLYDREEIRDVTAMIKTIINPNDPISLYRVLNIVPFRISYDEISKVLSDSRTRKVSLWEIIAESKNEEMTSLRTAVAEFQKNITKTAPTEFVYNLIHATGYLGQYTQEDTIENQLAIRNLDIFLNIIKKFEASFHREKKEFPTIVDFADFLELMTEAGDNPAQAEIEDIDTVNLLTVHAAKGLEFPVVFMVNTVSDRFPTRNQGDMIAIPDELIKETLPGGDEHIQEERRLFYVGMTRAQKYLYITFGKDYGGKREKRPSGFITETGIKLSEVTPGGNIKSQKSLFSVGSSFRETHATKIKNFTPSFLSYSQVDSYLSCPLLYKYRYVLNVPSLPNHALSFGTTIHDTLKEFHSMQTFDSSVSEETLLKIYEKNWQPLGYLDEEHRKIRFESGKKILERYYEENKNRASKPIALEKSFNIKVDGIKFYGRIDRIDKLPDGRIEIIDYKTGNAKNQKEVDKDMQVAVYAMAAVEALNIKPDFMSLYFVESGEKISTTRTDKQIQETREEIKNTVDRIKSGDFTATPGMQCRWCDYAEFCPSALKG